VSLLRRADPDADVEALTQRVHGVERCCSMCGQVAVCDVGEVVIRTDLAGDELVYGRCGVCRRLGVDWRRHVAAMLLAVPVDSVLLDGLWLDSFCERPDANPARPNREAWGHVDRAQLAADADKARADLDRRQGGPCFVCGSTLTPVGTMWRSFERTGTACGRCISWLGARPANAANVRVIATTVLVGQSTPAQRVLGPPGVGVDLGLVLFAESGRTRGAVAPWAHLDLRALTARARELGIGTTVDPARWLLIDRWQDVNENQYARW
jgi:hypothetical protein